MKVQRMRDKRSRVVYGAGTFGSRDPRGPAAACVVGGSTVNIPRQRRYPMRPISEASRFRRFARDAYDVPPLLVGTDSPRVIYHVKLNNASITFPNHWWPASATTGTALRVRLIAADTP